MKSQDFWAAKTSPIQKKEKDVVSNCTIPEERMVQFVFVIPDISHSSVKF